ncbi:hypothetical protein HYX58_05710 [Candidatus Dependentiae bacterium]|nr:hypothetical protein [Candidatus Dependentiae bacterium]
MKKNILIAALILTANIHLCAMEDEYAEYHKTWGSVPNQKIQKMRVRGKSNLELAAENDDIALAEYFVHERGIRFSKIAVKKAQKIIMESHKKTDHKCPNNN